MIARSGMYHVDPERLEEALAQFSADENRGYQGSSGAKGGLLLVNRTTGKLLGISLWEDEDSMLASEEGSQRLRVAVQRAGHGTDEIVREDWEVLGLRVSSPEQDRAQS